MKKKHPGRQTFYLSEHIREEICAEARRQDRPMSWLIQQAWKIARPQLQQLPEIFSDERQSA